MTEEAMRKLVEEALNLTEIEEHLIRIIAQNLDPEAVAQEIWDTWEDELTSKAAEVAAEEILPF